MTCWPEHDIRMSFKSLTNDELESTRMTEYVQLEGVPPERFDGDRARTRHFLNRFNRFALMNRNVAIMKSALKRCAYFLSLIEGPNVEGWSERAYERLDKIQQGIMTLPPFPPTRQFGMFSKKTSYSRLSTTQSANGPATS